RSAGQGRRRLQQRRTLAAGQGRHGGAHGRRQDRGARRPLRRHQGAVCRLLFHRCARSRYRRRMGRALPQRQIWRHRNPADGLMDAATRQAAERAARASYGRLVAFLAARTRDVAGAEDALAEAFATALRTWPTDGVPGNPNAWLLTVARRRQTDATRRRMTQRAGVEHLKQMADEMEAAAAEPDEIPDRRLALIFACAHPAIERGMRAPLILQTILGLTAHDIAAAFLIPAATMGQRLVRAKARIREAGIPFAIPDREALAERLDAVLDAIYAAYAKGWTEIGDT